MTSDIAKIEDLLVGSGAEDFRALKAYSDVFCPFEAIGMVGQEIRHAHFLAYILDPNRPHGFGAVFLEAFLFSVVAEGGLDGLSLIDLHLCDLSSAQIRREWHRIDLLIELPPSKVLKKGVVIAVELKIDASEGGDQLARYEKVAKEEFPDKDYVHGFVFLTKRGEDPSHDNREIWLPISLGDLVERLEHVVEQRGFTGHATEMFRAYTAMLRRHHLPNEKLKELSQKIWSKHRSALETLYDHRQDFMGDVFDVLAKESSSISIKLSELADKKIRNTESWPRCLRFVVQEWNCDPQNTPDDGDAKYLVCIELLQWGDKGIRCAFVLEPGESEAREELYKKIETSPIKLVRRTKLTERKKYISAKYLLQNKKYDEYIESDADPSEVARAIIEGFSKYIEMELPKFTTVICSTFSKEAQESS